MRDGPLSVVVFSGGRGSSVLSRDLIARTDVSLTLAINGYDDGLSTGEVRRFLGDSLGPSDFRKNASHLATALKTCAPALVDLLNARLPRNCTREQALAVVCRIDRAAAAGEGDAAPEIARLTSAQPAAVRNALRERLDAFVRELLATEKAFDFADCSIGNLVFAGGYLRCGRRFNAAVDDYSGLLGLPVGLIENVSDGTNAFLVALDVGDRLLASEADIVDANQHNRIKDIYILDRPLSPEERSRLAGQPPAQVTERLTAQSVRIPANPRLLEKIAAADLIVYSPGTQHSSLFPSYLTSGLSQAIARNLSALKLLITNIQSDAEIVETTAVEIIDKAAYYLQEKGQRRIPTPCLITHYLINDPRRTAEHTPYVPLGRLESLEDPRLVRIGNYEDGVTGRHDPAKVLTPYLQSLLARPRRRVAVWLYDGSPNKTIQTLLEMIRAGIAELPLTVTVFVGDGTAIDPELKDVMPFEVRSIGESGGSPQAQLSSLAEQRFDYVVLFESSGMYNGEDLVSLAGYLSSGRLDAVWGSRRLSASDIETSVRLRYKHHGWLRAASLIGSHALSAAYLLLYGRYVSDTLSGARVVRARYLTGDAIDVNDRLLNQRLLSRLLADRAEFLETPVRFYAMSPGQVRRTSVAEGLHALLMMLWWRVRLRSTAPRQALPAREEMLR
jgi:2-phospho-L-lactate transferase/gluconeogenesis factor (CofD/UPF0052 family)